MEVCMRAFEMLTGKPHGRNNIRMDLKKIGVNAKNGIDSLTDRD